MVFFSHTAVADPSTYGRGKGPPDGEKHVPFGDLKKSKLKPQLNFARSVPPKGTKLITVLVEGETDIPIVNLKRNCTYSPKIRSVAPGIPIEVEDLRVCNQNYFYFTVDGWISGANLKAAS